MSVVDIFGLRLNNAAEFRILSTSSVCLSTERRKAPPQNAQRAQRERSLHHTMCSLPEIVVKQLGGTLYSDSEEKRSIQIHSTHLAGQGNACGELGEYGLYCWYFLYRPV